MITCSFRFGGGFYWKLLPECTTCLGRMVAAVLPTTTTEKQIKASLKPTE